MIRKIFFDDIKKYNDAIIIDLRDKEQYDEKHIEGAVNLSLIKTFDYVKKYPLDKKIILYCTSGKRSMEAALLLENLGYYNLYTVKFMI